MIMKHDIIGFLTNSNEYDHNYELESINKDRFKVVRKDNLTTIYHKEPINRLDQIKMSDLIAELIFPFGIKVCFLFDSTNKYPKCEEPIMNVIHNEKGSLDRKSVV